ncbi:MAG: hypothetical protein CVU00_08075 [Bacteroidetes bacterium HGW-Bacteroidetes-17]|nr:MAG: hypothetical protein CVU00_08075 [Bacteroidetes bacterium HGW-Bacteroidetes-17]
MFFYAFDTKLRLVLLPKRIQLLIAKNNLMQIICNTIKEILRMLFTKKYGITRTHLFLSLRQLQLKKS